MDALRLPPEAELDELLAVAVQVARACGRMVVAERPARVEVAGTKTSAVDIVTEMDRRSEELARRLLTERRPDDGLVGEEGAQRAGTTGITWLVDPIDGTVNYLYDNDEYAVSVAAVVGDAHVDGGFWPVVGAVFNPASGELFAARRRGGARWERGGGSPEGPGARDDRTAVLHASPAGDLAGSLVGTGFAYEAALRDEQGVAVGRVLPLVRDIRRHGAASLDLCAVAAGRLDAYYESGLNPWDHAAAWVVVEEAGLVVRGPDGGRPVRELVLAGRPDILDALERVIAG